MIANHRKKMSADPKIKENEWEKISLDSMHLYHKIVTFLSSKPMIFQPNAQIFEMQQQISDAQDGMYRQMFAKTEVTRVAKCSACIRLLS
eukprot:UN08441